MGVQPMKKRSNNVLAIYRVNTTVDYIDSGIMQSLHQQQSFVFVRAHHYVLGCFLLKSGFGRTVHPLSE